MLRCPNQQRPTSQPDTPTLTGKEQGHHQRGTRTISHSHRSSRQTCQTTVKAHLTPESGKRGGVASARPALRNVGGAGAHGDPTRGGAAASGGLHSAAALGKHVCPAALCGSGCPQSPGTRFYTHFQEASIRAWSRPAHAPLPTSNSAHCYTRTLRSPDSCSRAAGLRAAAMALERKPEDAAAAGAQSSRRQSNRRSNSASLRDSTKRHAEP